MAKFTKAEALDEAVLLFTRKMRRLHTEEFAQVMKMLPDGAREALMLADNRADAVRMRDGFENEYPMLADEFEAEDGEDFADEEEEEEGE